MNIFFVRHGQTNNNKHSIHQSDDVPLNDTGREQARVVGGALQKFAPTMLIASPYTRAAESASIINESLNLPRTDHRLFVELKRPHHVINYGHFSPRSVWYMLRWFFGAPASYWERVGGESRKDFLARIKAAHDYLETQPTDARIIVVSHSIFINFFVEHICNDRPIPLWRAAFLLLKIKQLDNTSIVHVTYDPQAPENSCKWTLVDFDDDEHVAA